jgi:hypothetical protein
MPEARECQQLSSRMRVPLGEVRVANDASGAADGPGGYLADVPIQACLLQSFSCNSASILRLLYYFVFLFDVKATFVRSPS